MFNLLSPQIILTYLVAAGMVAVGGGSLLVRWVIGIATAFGVQIDPHVADLMLSPEAATVMFWGGMALFGYRRTEQRKIELAEAQLRKADTQVRQNVEIKEAIEKS